MSSLSDFKITDSDIAQKGVVAAPDKLTGTAAQNKAIFDRLIREVVKARYNEMLTALETDISDYLGQTEQERREAEEQRAENETTRVSNETARVSAESARAETETARAAAESARAAAENARAAAETERVSNEQARDEAERQRRVNEAARQDLESGYVAQAANSASQAEKWADVAAAQADRATVPPVEGVYNLVVSDRVTGEKYALVVLNGRLALLGVSANADTAHLQLVDNDTGLVYALSVESGRIILEEV